LTDRPLLFTEYQGGAFDFWGGPGYDSCRILIGPDFEKVFYATNIAVGSTLQSFYMTYGGTSWGYLPFPGVYTSYDYGAAITENRQLTAKYDQQKLTGYFLAAASPITKTDALPAPSQTNANLWVRGRMNPDDGTQLYVLRHADGASTNLDLTHLTLDLSGRTGYSYDDVNPALGYLGGGWTHASAQPWTAGDHLDSETFSATAGDSVTVAFHGPAIRWLSSLDGNHGIATVAIDGKQVAVVDTFGSAKQYQLVGYQTFDLEDADHTLTITVTGQRNPSASGSFVVVDAIDLPPVATGEFYSRVPQEPETAITLRGRDAQLLLANYRFGGQQMVYSTAQLLTQGTWNGTDLAILHAPMGEDSETVLRYTSEPTVQVVSGSARSTWNAGRGDLRLNTNHAGLSKVVITGGDRPDLVLLLVDQATAAQFWRFDTRAGVVLARGPHLIRSASMSHGRLELRGDTSTTTTLEVIASGEVRELTWNDRPIDLRHRRHHHDHDNADPIAGPLTVELPGPVAVTLPVLTWRYHFDTPESEPAFDDFGWTLAGHTTSLSEAANGSSPVLGGDEYGFHYGHLWYRGHFTALGGETGIFLSGSTGNSSGQFAAWLNGVYLGTGNGGTTLALPPGAVLVGQDNVVSVVIANMGHDQGTSKAQRGLISAKLEGSIATISWRVRGALGGETPVDPARGPLNSGGLHGERAGWFLPGYPDRGWQAVTLPFADTRPGIAWYRSRFDLDLPRGHDVPIVLRFEERSTRPYRAQIYLNGWNLGLFINNIGPQHDFALPAGLLRNDGENTLALAVWSNDAAGGLGPVSLAAVASHRGGVRVSEVRSPPYDPRRYVEPPPPAHLVLSGPDQVIRGGAATVTATLTVPGDRPRISDAAITLSLPAGWRASTDTTVAVGTIAPGRSASATWTVTAAAGDQPWTAMLTATAHLTVRSHHPDTRTVDAGKPVAVPPPAPNGDAFLSRIAFQSTNGWGPVERDMSNGEQAAGDGRPISLRGTVYATGLGAHATGDITVYLGGRCSSFSSLVGVDDETRGGGSVRFRVLADNREVAATGLVTGTSAPVAVTADLSGAVWLDLITDDGGDGNGLDHADWAEAQLHCSP
jgi:beta-galactosidase GanA